MDPLRNVWWPFVALPAMLEALPCSLIGSKVCRGDKDFQHYCYKVCHGFHCHNSATLSSLESPCLLLSSIEGMPPTDSGQTSVFCAQQKTDDKTSRKSSASTAGAATAEGALCCCCDGKQSIHERRRSDLGANYSIGRGR